MTLAELVGMLERRAAEAEREGATAPVANVYRLVLGELATLNGLNGPAPTAVAPDRMLTAPEVAQRIRASRRFVYAHRKALGGVALSKRALRFPESAITHYLARRS